MNECIAIQGLEMKFRNCEALRGIDLTIPNGSVFALLGENGAGKTTLIRILTGYQKPTSGVCRVLGFHPWKDAVAIRRRIGYVSDAPALYDWMRVDEIGWFASSFYPEGYLTCYREAIERYEVPLDRKIRLLSKGQKAKVALALATAHDPELLILDEPTSGLDPLVRREFMESMVDRAASGKTVLIASHQIAEVERVADYVAVIHSGRVVLTESISQLRESVFEVLVTLSDPLVELPQVMEPATLLMEQRSGRQVRRIVRGIKSDEAATLEAWPGVVSVRARSASLEEVYVACTRRSERKDSFELRRISDVTNDREKQAS